MKCPEGLSSRQRMLLTELMSHDATPNECEIVEHYKNCWYDAGKKF